MMECIKVVEQLQNDCAFIFTFDGRLKEADLCDLVGLFVMGSVGQRT